MWNRLKNGLSRTREALVTGVEQLIKRSAIIGEEFYEDLEATLLLGDVGMPTVERIVGDVRERIGREKLESGEQALEIVRGVLADFIRIDDTVSTRGLSDGLNVIMFAGVNGSGKTTTIAKLAGRFQGEGRGVMLAACDTFRAAAADQLEVWAGRVGAPIVRQKEGADPSAVMFDAVAAARARGIDLLLADTAGRLHTRVNLMEELKKMKRVAVEKAVVDDFHSWLVLDATLGQNSLQQVKVFREAIDIDSIIVAKLDGSAKGGVVFSIINEWKIPISYIGVGEGAEDLIPFDADQFAKALTEKDEDENGG